MLTLQETHGGLAFFCQLFPKIIPPAIQTIKVVLREAQRGKTLCIKLHVAGVNMCTMYREDPKRRGQNSGPKGGKIQLTKMAGVHLGLQRLTV